MKRAKFMPHNVRQAQHTYAQGAAATSCHVEGPHRRHHQQHAAATSSTQPLNVRQCCTKWSAAPPCHVLPLSPLLLLLLQVFALKYLYVCSCRQNWVNLNLMLADGCNIAWRYQKFCYHCRNPHTWAHACACGAWHLLTFKLRFSYIHFIFRFVALFCFSRSLLSFVACFDLTLST